MEENKYFSVTLPNGNKILLDENGNKIMPSDEVESIIKETGMINNDYTYKRWVMAQMFRMRNPWYAINEPKYKHYSKGELYLNSLRRKGFKYQLDTTIDMLTRIEKFKYSNPEDYALESRFWNREVAISILDNYIENINAYYDSLPTKRFHNLPYKRVSGLRTNYKGATNDKYTDVFDFPRNRKVLTSKALKIKSLISNPVVSIDKVVSQLKIFKTKYMILNVDNKFGCSTYLGWRTRVLNTVFENAYKGYGSYFTMQNMIYHHNCLVRNTKSIEESINKLNETLDNCDNSTFYYLFGLLNDTIKFNDFKFTNTKDIYYNSKGIIMN